ncbi:MULTISPECIES: tripartite tricarboxylate transporter permease [unclassified Chelatococcus]|uniref:tripartite tricarboxylate transporter permease n=1 Tax=unclassified Chelatococcus TaxID=2638111 RepID=UPI001BCAABE5|nr:MULTISPECIES: tripartite tricarboxylate transporter permease [unclassified Chelatococcus]MBS7699987.1 tripartite tricarboxylate transporter permease [Chelatococcus sp. YT9]MBX3558588.1 tripartite tricarboxylate transporter permease [Chelatococcus sp.]
MDVFTNLALGFSVSFQPINLFYCFVGTLLGTVVGVLPGIGPLATIAMLLPITFGLSSEGSLIMLAGIYYGSQYGGSTTAILLKLPGETSSAVTTIDGYEMAQKGRGGPALAAAAIGSFFAGSVATLLIALLAKPLTLLAFNFSPAEYFSLMVVGLVSSIALASGSIIKALGMIFLGLMLGLTGTDVYTGAARFTFGIHEMLDGLEFVAIAVGLFGISEIMRNLEQDGGAQGRVAMVGKLMPTREDFRRMIAPMVRGTAIGSFLGVLPGGGALLSSFVAYTVEKKVSPHGAEMGRGAIEGVVAPESANNAGAQTSFIPMLALGIPSNVIMALMIGALIIQGVVPGPGVINNNPALFWGLVVSMWVGNAMLLILNLPLVGLWVKLLQIPYTILFPIIVAFCCIGVYSVNNASFGVYQITAAGLLGYVLIKLECELAPFILGFILGPMIEENFRRAMLISGGDATVFFSRPVSAVLLLLAAIILVVVMVPAVTRKRDEVFIEEN